MKKRKAVTSLLWGACLAAGASFVLLVAGLSLSGAAKTRILMDPGGFVRWGLPCSQNISYIAMAATIAALTFAMFILPRYREGPETVRSWKNGRQGQQGPLSYHPLYLRALTIATIAAVVWALSTLCSLLLGYADITGVDFFADDSLTEQLSYFVFNISIGQAKLAVTLIAAVVSVICCAARSATVVALAGALSGIGVIPLALIGHAAGADDHALAVNAQGLHLLGMSLWFGGIIVLMFLSPIMSADAIAQVLPRFSQLAFFCFWLVALSGVISASLRIKTAEQAFGTSYGLLVLFKGAATLVLGVIGMVHRQWIIPRLRVADAGPIPDNARAERIDRPKRRISVALLWRLIMAELIIMGCTAGIAVALGRSAPPTPEILPEVASVARIISGYELPPRFEPYTLITQWRFDWLWIVAIFCAGAFYVRGIVQLRKRGISWNLGRTACWFVGLATLFYVTSGAVAVYGHILFSAHMVDHMVLTMVAPFFLVLGAPVTLSLKALRPRRDGSSGLREWLLILLHSRFSAFITNPIVAAVNFVGSIIIFYYTEVFHFAMYTHIGHEWMYFHFLMTGYIFVSSMIGLDPAPRRVAYPVRLIFLIAAMGFHAFFGIGLMLSPGLLLASWFGGLGRPWGDPAIVDQQLGGAIAWSLGEIPTMVLAVVVAVQWSMADKKEAKRIDRHEERTAGAQLAAYNEMFAELARRDREQVRR